MKDRVNLALADIRFIQTEIQKILNRQGKFFPKGDGPQSGRKDRKSSKEYQSNFSPTSRKNSKIYEDSRNTSPRVKKKESSKKKIQTINNSPQRFEEIQSKVVKTQPKEQIKPIAIPQKAPQAQKQPKQQKQLNEQRSIMQMWKQKQKQSKRPQPITIQQPNQNPQKSAMMLWKQRQRQKTGGTVKQVNFQNNISKIKENSQLKQVSFKNIQSSKEMIKPQIIIQQIFQSTNIFNSEPAEVHHLLKKNNIPLRSDEDYLKKKYNYAYHQQDKEKEEQLRERYRLLDQRLIRLKYEIKARDSNLFQSSEGHSQSKQAKVIKKHALAKYDRYSPLNKFVRINQKLKKDYERSLSNKQRHNSKKKVEVEQGRSSWLK